MVQTRRCSEGRAVPALAGMNLAPAKGCRQQPIYILLRFVMVVLQLRVLNIGILGVIALGVNPFRVLDLRMVCRVMVGKRRPGERCQ